MAFTALAAVAATTAATIYSGNQTEKASNRASDRATQIAAKQSAQAEEDMNRANVKRPNTSAILAANEQAAKGGIGSTMLTGPSGIDLGASLLGRNTLLGS